MLVRGLVRQDQARPEDRAAGGQEATPHEFQRFFVSVVDVAQLVRAPDCDSGGRGFKSRLPPHCFCYNRFIGPLAQLVEQLTLNQ